MELLLGLFESGLFKVRVKFTVFIQFKKGAKDLLSGLKFLVCYSHLHVLCPTF